MIRGVAMQKEVPTLAEYIGMNRQIGPGRTITLQSRNKSVVAVMIALHEMEIAPRITANQIVDPAESMLHGVVGRG